MLPHVFDMFSQATAASSRSQGGLGIGLSLVKGLVEMHGGTVEARSDGPGQGSEFVVRLPLVADRPMADAGLEQTPAAVDPVPPAASWWWTTTATRPEPGACCSGSATTCASAYDGEAGCRRPPRFRPDVVLLDIGMPG